MSARELFKAGRLPEAIQALGAEVRDNPTDARRRTFLFELLCFAGEYDRAEKHLAIIADGNANTEMGALLYRGALNAERTRADLFARREFPVSEAEPVSGKLNGQEFSWLSDADPRIGPRLEVFAAGAYLWIPFAHISSIEIEAPKRLRDLLWIPAIVRTGPSFRGRELGEVLIPALAPFSYKHADGQVRLGRSTVFEQVDGETLPFGQKMLTVDEEDFPLLEVRTLEISGGASME